MPVYGAHFKYTAKRPKPYHARSHTDQLVIIEAANEQEARGFCDDYITNQSKINGHLNLKKRE